MDVFCCSKRSKELLEKVHKIFILYLLLLMQIPIDASSEDFTNNLVIQSDAFEMSLNDRKAYLTGGVKIDSDNVSVRADGMEVIFIDDSKEVKNLLDDINNIKTARIFVEKGYVKASVGKYKIECKEIIGNMSDKKIVMMSAKMTDGHNKMSGDKITYDMISQKLSVTSNKNNKVRISIKEDGIKALEGNN